MSSGSETGEAEGEELRQCEIWCEPEQRETVVQAVRWDMAVIAGEVAPTAQPPETSYGRGRGRDSPQLEPVVFPIWLGGSLHDGAGGRVQ